MIDSRRYNTIRLGIKRLKSPLRIPLEGLKNLELILEDDAWVCVDLSLDELPILAWLRFRPHDRTALHEPVRCELRFFHQHASIIMDQVLDKVEAYIRQKLPRTEHPGSDTVTPIKTD